VPPTLGDRLAHILEAILDIEQMLVGKTRANLADEKMLRLALERELEIISEASRKIPDLVKAQQTDIDWEAMAALGNRLRHAYHRIDIDILFSIAESDLPPLKTFIERVIAEDKKR